MNGYMNVNQWINESMNEWYDEYEWMIMNDEWMNQ